MRRKVFIRRAVGLWNSLPRRAVEPRSLRVFKREIHTFLVARGINVYVERVGEWS